MKVLNFSWIIITSVIIFLASWFLWIGSEEQYKYLENHLTFNILKRTLVIFILGSISILILFFINLIKTKDISKSLILLSYGLLITLLFSHLGTLMFFKNLII